MDGIAQIKGLNMITPANNHHLLKWSLVIFAAGALGLAAHASLVGQWKFTEGTGTSVADSSGLGNHGTLINPQPNSWTNAFHGGGLYLDGTTGAGCTYVTIPNAPSLQPTTAISFAAWLRCDDPGRDAPILDKEGPGKLSYWFGTFPTAHFGLLLATDASGNWAIGHRSQGTVPTGLWVLLVSTWDGTTIRHYLNGVQLPETAPFAGPIIATDTPLVIGANVPFNTTAFRGTLGELRLYNHALSQAEITTLAGVTPQPVGHWSFDEAGGTNILDRSGQANHGTIIHLQTNTWTRGIRGSALYFDGVTGLDSTYVAVPDSPSLRIVGDISFSAWVRCDDLSRDAPILAKEGDGHLSYWFGTYGTGSEGTAPGDFGVLLDADGNQPWTTYNRDQGTIPAGQWVHLASVRSGSTISHYLNGQPLAHTGTFVGPIHVSDAFLTIGVNSLYNYTAFKGAIDEVSLYNYALTPAEVQALYVTSALSFTSVASEGNDLRLTWRCAPDQMYEIQTNADLTAVGTGFAPLISPVVIPTNYVSYTTNYLHRGALTNAQALYYRLKLLP